MGEEEFEAEAAALLLPDFKNKPESGALIKTPQRSGTTVTRRSKAMSEDLTWCLWKDIADSECFSLQLDEPADNYLDGVYRHDCKRG